MALVYIAPKEYVPFVRCHRIYGLGRIVKVPDNRLHIVSDNAYEHAKPSVCLVVVLGIHLDLPPHLEARWFHSAVRRCVSRGICGIAWKLC